jgi:MoaA/NifB/PqqE/SkfB family radical SAM enzyme
MDLEKEKIHRLISWYKGKKCGPYKIDIEIHRRCNLRCLSCSRRADGKYERINEFSKTIEMTKRKWLNVVDEAAKLGVVEWHIAGGGDPPLLSETVFPVLKRIKEHKMYGILTTNGTNLTQKQIQMLVDISWDRIHFSIDGPDAKTHDYLRQVKGCFKKTVSAIKTLNEYKTGQGKDKPMLNMNTVLSVRNYTKLDKMVELAKKLRIEYMFVEPLIVYSKYGNKLKLKEDHLKIFPKCLKKAKELAEKYRIDNNFSNFDKNLDKQLIEKSSSMNEIVKEDMNKQNHPFLSIPCYDPWFHMTIKADGRVISCDIATDDGDDIKDKTLAEVWYGPYFERHREMLLEKKIPNFCAQCNPSHTTQRRRLRKELINAINEQKSYKILDYIQNIFQP